MTRRHRKKPPSIWLMTDERVAPSLLLKAVERLPRGKAAIVFRHYRTGPSDRRALFDQLAAIARRRGLPVLLAGSTTEAIAWGADGWHGAGRSKPGLLHSMSAHDARELRTAQRLKADVVFLSPLFPTRSHPGAAALGPTRFAALARRSGAPVMALGGVKRRHAPMLKALGAAGWGAIDGLVRQR